MPTHKQSSKPTDTSLIRKDGDGTEIQQSRKIELNVTNMEETKKFLETFTELLKRSFLVKSDTSIKQEQTFYFWRTDKTTLDVLHIAVPKILIGAAADLFVNQFEATLEREGFATFCDEENELDITLLLRLSDTERELVKQTRETKEKAEKERGDEDFDDDDS